MVLYNIMICQYIVESIMINELHDILFNGGKRIIPKRNLNWLKNNHNEIYIKLIELFPSNTIKEIYYYLKNDIVCEKDIPICEVCHTNKVSLYRDRLLNVCGNKCAISHPSVQKKTKDTCQLRYGVDRKWGINEKLPFGEHYTQRHLKNLNDVHNTDLMESMQGKHWKEVAEYFGLSTNTHSSVFQFMEEQGFPLNHNQRSSEELLIERYIRSIYVGEIIIGTRKVISPYEIDIYLPECNIAIEVNGNYWHSVKVNPDKYYHFRKTELCHDLGIRLFHINEFEFENNNFWKDILDNTIHGNTITIDIDECEVKDISSDVYCIFMRDNYHRCSYGIIDHYQGIFHDNKLIAVIHGEEIVCIPLYSIVSSYKLDIRVYGITLHGRVLEPSIERYNPLLEGYNCGYLVCR